MAKKSVTNLVSDLLTPFLAEKSYELVDVEFVKEGPHRYLRVYIDKEEGVSLDDCEVVSGFLSEKLDKLDPIEENYFLEVSSPGVERPLKKDSDFEKFKGETVEAKLYETFNGQKVITGTLIGLVKGEVHIKSDLTNEVIEIPRSKIAVIRLTVTF